MLHVRVHIPTNQRKAFGRYPHIQSAGKLPHSRLFDKKRLRACVKCGSLLPLSCSFLCILEFFSFFGLPTPFLEIPDGWNIA